MTPPRSLLSLVTILLLASAAPAQRTAPPPPATYSVLIRYRIRIGGNEHVVQYREMTRYLESIGFQRTDTPDPNEPVDADADRMAGTLPSNRVADLLREPHVKTILLMPAGYKLPDNPEQRVLVQLKLANNLSPTRQQELFIQSLDKLRQIGLIEKVGYDHEGFTRILGTIPADDVDLLLTDLRSCRPVGSRRGRRSRNCPSRSAIPIRSASPRCWRRPRACHRAADVAMPPPLPDAQGKIASDLRAAAAEEKAAGTVRLEVVLTRTPGLDDTSWRALCSAQSGIAVEGRIGPVVSILALPAAINTLAALPEIATVRPPRAATIQAGNAKPQVPTPDMLAATGLERLHKMSFRGAGVHVAIIDADFAGLDKKLSKNLIDLPPLAITRCCRTHLRAM